MARAVLRNGVLVPVDPLPAEWTDGHEVWLEDTPPQAEDSPEAIDKWYRELEELCAENDPRDLEEMQAFLSEIRQEARTRARREAGLS
jgi:hypothetical protein